MKKPTQGKEAPSPSSVLSLRLDPTTLTRIDEVAHRYARLHFVPGFSQGEPRSANRSQIIRFAVEEGLSVLEGNLRVAENKKRKPTAR